MTLRLRLVLALGALLLVGLTMFGVTTYTLYARSQYQRLDSRIQGFVPLVTRQLEEAAGLSPGQRGGPGGPGGSGGPPPGPGGSGGPPPGPGGGPGQLAPLGTYGELRGGDGKVITRVQVPATDDRPRLPEVLIGEGRALRFFTAGSATGSGEWRVAVNKTAPPRENTVAVAVPLDEVTTALQRLILIETSGGAIVVAILSIGAWFILRRGLRPLEAMADTAGSIAAGDLTHRVDASKPRTEIGQLGVAFNSMLDEIQAAFAERDATEARLRQFLADASHELRTPLTSIQGFAELFRLQKGPDQVDLPTILRRIEQESARMRVLVEDLLLLVRLDETRPVDRAPVDLAVLAADACSDAVAVAPDRPVTLDAPDPVVVLGDQAHLRQAIANLVTNAVRHTPPGTPIEVAARLKDGKATVAVRDHGPGLDEAALAHAFDRFWQADEARSGSGAGLGLSIVAGIAAEHGGTASVANLADGGAEFSLRLPISSTNGQAE